jgi:23S rRNA pseudouridine2605 synthase
MKTESAGTGGERIAKYLARAGVASRREAERLIEQGIVTVDGEILTTPAFKVLPGMEVRVDGTRVGAKEPVRLWRYHKPAGLVTTHKDPQARPTVFDAVAKRLPRVISVGRLDLTTEGLLLLTNDGGLARQLELPSTGWVRRYRVRAFGDVDAKAVAALGEGVTIDGVKYKPIKAEIDKRQGDNLWLTISLTEGKNREVRKVMEYLGLRVNRLIRTAYGPFQLGALAKDAIEEIPGKQLREQLGKKMSEELGI